MEMNTRDDLVPAGLRINSILVWRPDLFRGKVYDCSKEEWCENLRGGSHRMKSSWVQDRMSWLDAEGKPQKADCSRSERATVEADLAEADYVDAELAKFLEGQISIGGKKAEVADITIECDDQSLFTDVDVVRLLHPKLNRL